MNRNDDSVAFFMAAAIGILIVVMIVVLIQKQVECTSHNGVLVDTVMGPECVGLVPR